MYSQSVRKRRRRVALDQTQSAPSDVAVQEQCAEPVTEESRKTVARSYTPGARRSRQFRTTDLIPKRIWSVTAVIALLLSAIAGLNLLHLNSPNWIGVIGADGIAALSLDSGQGLSVWYSNFLLLLTSCVSLQLYLLRQHRRDDYKGSYRIWLWLAVIFLIASAASVTGISTMCRNVVSSLLGSETIGTSLVWIVSIKLTGLTLLVVRGLIEVRYSRLAVAGLLTVLLAYGMANLIIEIPDVRAQSSEFIHAALGNCLLIGCTALFVSVLGFARFVYLDANGLIQARDRSEQEERREERARRKAEAKQQKRERKQQLAEAETEPEAAEPAVSKKKKKKRADANETEGTKAGSKESGTRQATSTRKKRSADQTTESESTPASRKKKKKSTAKTESRPVSDDFRDSGDEDEMERLSKSERRRQRKLKRRNERRAA